MKRSFNPWLLVMFIILAIFIFNQLNSGGTPNREIAYSEFLRLVDEGQVSSVIIQQDDTIQGQLVAPSKLELENGKTEVVSRFRTIYGTDPNLPQRLEAQGVGFKYRNPSPWLGILFSLLPIIILIAFFWFIFMRAQGGPSQVMQFGQSRAKMYGRENKVNTTFDDVAGHEEAKQELREIVDFLKHPKKYHQIGAKIPKGVLLVGPPGTGKTLLSRAVAGEAGVPFLTVSASEFMEMFVGVGASRVRSLFDEARKASPSIIFIDELDSIGRRRGAGIGGGHDEREQTLNQILSEMDGFEKDTSVIVMAATNRPDILDPALLRPGRFDRQVTIGLPTQREREAILRVHVRNKPIADDVSLERLSNATPMFSGADLENLTNEAALIAARANKKIISWSDFNEALDRIILGLRKGSLIPSEEERRILAYHEAGHAIAQVNYRNSLGEVRKVTIMPRGGAGGFMSPLEKEELVKTREKLFQRLIVSFAGRVAEKKLTGEISTGAASDLKQATDLAKRMIFDFGMGEQEYVAWGSDNGPVFLGGEISRRKDFSEETARELEKQINRILADGYDETEKLISANWTAVSGVAEALLQYETLDGQLIHHAFQKSLDGMSAEDVADWIVGEAKAQETAIREASRRIAEEHAAREEERRKERIKLEPRPVE
ncbi:MAG: ATP-dependent zinc metalloprotease FtsH [Deinococcales bacterium]